MRTVKLSNVSVAHNDDTIVVHDGLESVSDGDDGRVAELSPDGSLDQIVSFKINGGCGLVQY